MNYFLFATVDSSHFELKKIFSAKAIILKRLSQSKWPLYSRTHHKSIIKQGDKCLFYVGGYKDCSQHVIGQAEIGLIKPENTQIDSIDILTGVPEKICYLHNVVIYDYPVCFKSHVPSLNAIKNKKYWGVSLQGGCTKLDEVDFKLLCSQ